MPKWPPVKAWTNIRNDRYNMYFVAINYGIKNNEYYVHLVSLIDGSVCFDISFESLKDSDIWLPGWKDLSEASEDAFPSGGEFKDSKPLDNKSYRCPSADSGLNIPTETTFIREWYPD